MNVGGHFSRTSNKVVNTTYFNVFGLLKRSINFLCLFQCSREVYHVKNNPINEREHTMDEEMVRRHKHVFFADRLQECVQEHISYQRRRDHSEPLIAPRLFIIYDNVEASEPGDTSDYCAVLDAPFYKLRIEDCKESGNNCIKIKERQIKV